MKSSENFKIVKEKKYLILIILLLLSVTGFYLFYRGYIKNIAENRSYMEFIADNEDSNIGEIKTDTKIEQTFRAKDDFKGISIRFLTYARENEGQLKVSLISQEDDTTVGEWHLNTKELKDNSFHTFELDKIITNCEGKEFKIILDLKGLNEENYITLSSSSVNQYHEGELYVNEQFQDVDLCIATIAVNANFLKYMYFAIVSLLTIFIVSIYYLIFIKKAKIENVFLVSAICLGLTCTFLQTPYSNCDEPAHINTAYRYSNKLFGINNAMFNGPLPKRAIDNYGGLSYDRTTISTYRTVYDNLFKMADKSERQLVPIQVTRVKEAPYIYLPSVIGITIARVLHLGQIPLLMLGRIFNLAFFIGASYLAIKKMPFAKIILFVVALVPMNLSQNTTFSYDSVITGLAYLFTAYCLSIAFGKEEVSRKDLILFFIISILLAPLKKVYVLMCFIALIIPKSRFRDIKKYRMFLITLICSIGAFYLLINAVEAVGVVTEQQGVAAFSQSESYTFSDIISNPLSFVYILFNSIVKQSYTFLYDSIISFYKVALNSSLTLIYIVLLLLSTIKKKEEEVYLKPSNKLWIILLLSGIMLGIMAAGFTWTVKGNNLIEGVQGRYMLPFLPFILLLFRNSNLVLNKSIDRELMFSVSVLNVVTLISLFQVIISI